MDCCRTARKPSRKQSAQWLPREIEPLAGIAGPDRLRCICSRELWQQSMPEARATLSGSTPASPTAASGSRSGPASEPARPPSRPGDAPAPVVVDDGPVRLAMELVHRSSARTGRPPRSRFRAPTLSRSRDRSRVELRLGLRWISRFRSQSRPHRAGPSGHPERKALAAISRESMTAALALVTRIRWTRRHSGQAPGSWRSADTALPSAANPATTPRIHPDLGDRPCHAFEEPGLPLWR